MKYKLSASCSMNIPSRRWYDYFCRLICVIVFIGMSFVSYKVSASEKKEEEPKRFLLICTGYNCKTPEKGKEDRSSHIAFTIETGRNLLTTVKTLKMYQTERDTLQKQKEELMVRIVEWKDKQLKVAEVTIQQQGVALKESQARILRLEDDKTKLIQEVVKYKNQRTTALIVGICVGVGVTVVVVGAVGIAFLMK